MRNEFRVKDWRKFYDQVRILGEYLKDSRADADGNPPKFRISLEERRKAEDNIKNLLKMSDDYLDRCRLYPRERKWKYDRENETTWSSSDKFEYKELMPHKSHVIIRL